MIPALARKSYVDKPKAVVNFFATSLRDIIRKHLISYVIPDNSDWHGTRYTISLLCILQHCDSRVRETSLAPANFITTVNGVRANLIKLKRRFRDLIVTAWKKGVISLETRQICTPRSSHVPLGKRFENNRGLIRSSPHITKTRTFHGHNSAQEQD